MLKTPFGSLHKILINYTMQIFLQGKRELTFKTQHTNHIHSQHSFCNYKFHIYPFAYPIKPTNQTSRTRGYCERPWTEANVSSSLLNHPERDCQGIVLFPTMCCTAYYYFFFKASLSHSREERLSEQWSTF